MTLPEKSLSTYAKGWSKNPMARVCEQCGGQYPPDVLRCPQDGEATLVATTAYPNGARAVFSAPDAFFGFAESDKRPTPVALAPLGPSTQKDHPAVEDIDVEEHVATRHALRSVASQESEQDKVPTFFALKPVQYKTLPPVFDEKETSIAPRDNKGALALVEDHRPTSRSSQVTDPGIELLPTKKSAPTEPEIALSPKAPPKREEPKKPQKPGSPTEPAIALSAKAPTLLENKEETRVFVPKPKEEKPAIEKPLPSKVLRSIPLAQTAKRPSLRPRYLGYAFLMILLLGGGSLFWTLQEHVEEKRELQALASVVEEKIDLSLRSTPSGARVTGTINGEPFSARLTPNSITAPKGAQIKLTFEYANYTSTHDQFIADSPREVSVHLAPLPAPVQTPQLVVTQSPKRPSVPTPSKPNRPSLSSAPKGNTPKAPAPTKTQPPADTGKARKPLPATPEL